MVSKYQKKTVMGSIWIVAVVVIFITLVVAFLFTVETFLSRSVERQSLEIINQGEQQLEKKVEANFKVLRLLARQVAEKDAMQLDMQKMFADVGNFEYLRIGYIGKSGMAQCSDGSVFDASGRSYYADSLSGKEAISNVLADKVGTEGELIIVMSVPVIKNDVVSGVLFATMPKRVFAEIVNIKFYDSMGYTLVADNTGNIIFASQESNLERNIFDYITGNQQIVGKFKKQITENGMGIAELIVNDSKAFVGYRNIKKMADWNLMVVIPTAAIFTQIRDIEHMGIGLFVVMIAIFLAMSLYMLYYQYKQDKLVYAYAYFDKVTGVRNSHGFVEKLEQLLRNGKLAAAGNKSALISLDVDNFKLVNNLLGFAEGNRFLALISQSLQRYWGTGAVYGRLSNDNLVVLINDYETPTILGKRIQDFVRIFHTELVTANFKMQIELSIGIYVIDEKDADIYKIVDKATYARLAAKGNQRGKIIFYDNDFFNKSKSDYLMEQEIREALQHHQFSIHLQPKFAFADKKIIGAEALIRWYHPTIGLIPPFKFIEAAEKTGLIVDIDRYVLIEVCKLLSKSLKAKQVVYPIAINCSMVEFYQADFVQFIKNTMELYQIPYELLEIEITETTIISEIKVAQNIINQLKSLGITVTMDDFGTGYSSLSYLQRIPFDCMKLDKSFLNEFENDLRGRNIIKAIIDLAKNMQLRVVAEGVETSEQADFLAALNCDYVQGYYFAKPMPVDDYQQLIASSQE